MDISWYICCMMCGVAIHGTYTTILNGPPPAINVCHDCEKRYFTYRYLNELEY